MVDVAMGERCIIEENRRQAPAYIREGRWFGRDRSSRSRRRLDIRLDPVPVDERAAYVEHVCWLLVKSRFDTFHHEALVNDLVYRLPRGQVQTAECTIEERTEAALNCEYLTHDDRDLTPESRPSEQHSGFDRLCGKVREIGSIENDP